MIADLDVVKQACARLHCGERRGTGYLVSPDTLITCEHVVGAPGSRVVAHFDPEIIEGTVTAVDADTDCASVRLDRRTSNRAPLAIPTWTPALFAPWLGFGFPESNAVAGLPLSGEIRDCRAKDDLGNPALLVAADAIAAGSGARLHGFSGSPVVVGRFVVGHLKRVITDTGRAEFGYAYACPVEHVMRLVPALRPERRPTIPQPPGSTFSAEWHVRRPVEERAALQYLAQPSTPAVLWAPENFGQSWLMRFLLEEVERHDGEGTIIAEVDFGLFEDDPTKTYPFFLREFAAHVTDAAGIQLDLDAAFTPGRAPNLALKKVLESLLLRVQEGKRFVLAIARADRVGKYAFGGSFFALLRGVLDKVGDPWARLRLVLSVSTTPAALIDGYHSSPFNLSPPIALPDFDAGQVSELAERYCLAWGPPQIKLLMDVVGGHPYLVRHVMHTANLTGLGLDELLQQSDSIFDDFLGRYRTRLGKQPHLLETLRRIANGQGPPRHHVDCERLHRAGLIRTENNRSTLRYPLYASLVTDT